MSTFQRAKQDIKRTQLLQFTCPEVVLIGNIESADNVCYRGPQLRLLEMRLMGQALLP
jgi:hypothetical protein